MAAKIGLGLLIAIGLVVALAAIAWLALRRPDIPYAQLEAKYATPTSHFVDLPGGIRMHYRDDGPKDAPVVMLVHGYGDSFLTWGPWIERLSPKFRVVTIDLAGHGLTRAPANYDPDMDKFADQVDALAAKLALPPFAIVGNSMGGGVAWQVASRYPQRIRALVLVDAAGWPPDPNKPVPLAFKILQSKIGRFLLQRIETRPLTAEGLKMDVVDDALITPAFVDRWVEVQRAPGHRAILMNIHPGAHTVATEAVLSKITAPTLVLHGEQDVIIEPESGRKFAAAIPGAKLITYPNAGHLPQYEVPDQSAADVTAFLQSLPAPAIPAAQ
ncbi:alpha/beta fold hydrolase [Phenylobacterium sp.]|uniref:alpha/beta fold hydrolase n=1 Tax=Phenylobacterium sp. TaxID=1871053 RepID=UPI0035B3D3A4